MPIPRKLQISPEIARHYHLISRCVRRAFLCGRDFQTGRNFEHRRQWVVDRLALLEDVFAIDICAYSVMTNHLHCVARLEPERADRWTAEEVITRWRRIYGKPAIVQAAAEPDATPDTVAAAARKIEQLRERLKSISWFMKSLNEYVARRANAEDECTGAFWEGRFKSQALLDERALLACMTYVDLNPIRAAIANTPEESDYTSIQQRIRRPSRPEVPLVPFADEPSELPREARPIKLADALPIDRNAYLELVDWTGRVIVQGKPGSVPASLPPILERLAIDDASWAKSLDLFRGAELRFLGPADAIQDIANRLARKWFKGISACRAVFGYTTSVQ